MIMPIQVCNNDVRNGKAPALTFEEAYASYFTMVYRVCFSYTKNPADSEDLAADVFVKLLKNSTHFNDAEHEKAWLLRTTINTCKDYFRHWWRKRGAVESYESIEGVTGTHHDEILALILDLPTRYKDVVYLYYYEGYQTPELASMLKKPHSTIRNHLSE